MGPSGGLQTVPSSPVDHTGERRATGVSGQPQSARSADMRFAGASRIYRTGAGVTVQALCDVTLDIPAGQTVGVTGRSGSGKSTLLNLAGAMDVADRGTVSVDGRDLGSISGHHGTVLRWRVGLAFQRFHLLSALTTWDNVAAPVAPFKTAYDKRARARELLAAVGLAGREHDIPAKAPANRTKAAAPASTRHRKSPAPGKERPLPMTDSHPDHAALSGVDDHVDN